MSSGFLIHILLPLYDNAGVRFGEETFAATRAELLERFGGVTAYQRAPARGLWKTDDGAVAKDDLAVFEVMVEDLDRAWWAGYRRVLERRFRQDAIVIRAVAQQLL